jgi:hypothetical protein
MTTKIRADAILDEQNINGRGTVARHQLGVRNGTGSANYYYECYGQIGYTAAGGGMFVTWMELIGPIIVPTISMFGQNLRAESCKIKKYMHEYYNNTWPKLKMWPNWNNPEERDWYFNTIEKSPAYLINYSTA